MHENNTHIEKWERVLRIIKDNISEDVFNAWFAPVNFVSCVDNKLTLGVPSEYFVSVFEDRFYSLIKSSIKREYGEDIKLYYVFNLKKNEEASKVKIEGANASLFVKEEYDEIDSQLNASYNFDNYCESNSNKLAVSIGKAIAENPDCRTFSPMFLFGDTGVGKTHLIQAIGLKVKELRPASRVLYVTARVFESQYTTAVRKNTTNDFINFYQSIDVLILDDIQEFAGKVATQNTFYYIFNYLHQNGKQLIMSSDCPPSEMDGIIPRLISRFKWGITVKLEKPDYELRRDVLKMRSSRDGLELPMDVLDFIAHQITDSVRELEGVVASLLAHATILNQDICLDLAKVVVSNAVKVTKKQTNFEIIAETVCRHFDVDTSMIYGKCRRRNVNDARQVVMYLAKKYTQMSSINIGMRLSRDHATVLHACKKITETIPFDKQLKRDIEAIEDILNS